MARMIKTIDNISGLPIYHVRYGGSGNGDYFVTSYFETDGYEREINITIPYSNNIDFDNMESFDAAEGEVYRQLIYKFIEELSLYKDDIPNCFFTLPNNNGVAVIDGKIRYWEKKYWD